MRNLKRALSLTLASVMLLGMMVVGTSAKGYDDVDADDNVEAIEVLQAVEVMVGDDRGFGPDRPVTRNEMAVVMGKLLNLNYNYYVSTCPFTDVAEWARGWVGACYANGIVSGRGDGIYDGEATVTAVEAASMMMRALGYFKYTEDYADGFNVVTVRQGSEIGIFNDVGTDAATPMTRNQVAQMALNALKANMVVFTGTPGIEVNGVKVGYKAEYTPRTSPDGKYAAIGKLVSDIGRNDQYYIQLGEELYDGDLRLNDTTDDFGRPARYWEYDGTAIGTYAKKELIQETYTAKVTGKTLYDLLGKDLVNLINGDDPRTSYTLSVTVDGNDDNATHTKVFGKSALTRTNTDAVGGTGNGVLTEVYVDNTARSIDIAIINTYLAIADNDYNEKKDEVSLNIYNLDKDGSLYFKDYKREGQGDSWRDAENALEASGEDFNIADVKKDDKFLVTVANGEIKSVVAPEILTEQTITSHKTHDYVVADKQYDYTTTAQYDDEVMDTFGSDDLKEVTYNIVLDEYGYLIGVERNEAVNQYVFLTGVDDEFSHLSQKNVPANVIFLDGTMKTVTINAKKSVLRYDATGNTEDTSDGHNDDVWISNTAVTPGTVRKPSQANMWCTYSVDSDGIYTLKAVAGVTDAANRVKVAQSSMDADDATTPVADQVTINSKNISLDGSAPFNTVHGNADTVYINTTALENVDVTVSDKRMIVDDVDTVTTGVTNVDMTVKNIADSGSYGAPEDEIYTLYNDKGVIIAVVTLGAEDNATTAHYAYINSSSIKERGYDESAKEFWWTREAIVDGEFVMLKEVDDNSSSEYLDAMTQGNWYEILYNADNEVRGFRTVDYPSDSASGSAPSGKTAPDGFKNSTITRVGTHYMQDANYVARELDKTFILNTHRFTGNVELKTLGYTLYTGNDTTQGFVVSPTAKVVVFTKNYDKHEEYTGAEMEKALNALVNKKAFDGYVNAVIGDNGIATVVILDEKNMDAPDTYTVSFIGGENVTIAGTVSGIAKNGTASFTVTGKPGYTVDSVMYGSTPLTPDTNGRYTINNITDNISVTINTTKDPNAYAGTVVFNTSNKTAVTAEWTGSAAPGESELASLLIDELVRQGYDKSTASITSLTNSDVSIEIKKTINGVAGPKETFKIDPSSNLTEVEEISTAEALADKITVNSTKKVKLTGNATITAVPTMDIEVDSGKTLTLNGAMTLTKAITGAGSVAASDDISAADKIAVTGGISVVNGKKLTAANNWAIPSDVTGAGKIDGATTAITNGARIKCTGGLTLSTGSVDTLSGVPLEVTGTASSLTTGRVAPSTLTFGGSAAVTLNSTNAELVVPAGATIGTLTITDGKLTLAGAATVADGKTVTISDAADFATFKLTGGDTSSKVSFGASAAITGFTPADQNFYAKDDTNKVADVTTAMQNKEFTWNDAAGGTGTAGWKAGS